MKSKYAVLMSVVLFLGLVYYFVSYQTKESSQDDKNSKQSLSDLVNQSITLEGTTADAKTGAILLVDDNPVYVEGLDYWPLDFVDKQVTLSGKLVLKNYIPEAEVSENDEISQGGNDEDEYVLEQAVIETGKGVFGYQRLTDTAGFAQDRQEVLQAITTALEQKKENPQEFFVTFRPEPVGAETYFTLAHQDFFKLENLSAIGNPSTKNKRSVYNTTQKRIINLFYFKP